MKLLFILNPIAGKGSNTDAIPVIESYCKRKDISYKIFITKYPNNAEEIAKNEVNSDYDAIISIGGDGTLLEVANGLIDTNIPLGIIPLGSGNDFAKALNIPTGFKNIEKALDIIVNTDPVKIDSIKFRDKVFLNIGSVGFDAEVIYNLPRFRKWVKGGLIYIFSVLFTFFTYKNKFMTLIIDGEKIQGEYFLSAVCNGIAYGGGFVINPNGIVNDGYIDLILVEKVSRLRIIFALKKFFQGRHQELSFVKTYKCKSVSIISHNELVVNVDGNCDYVTPITFNILPLSFRVFGLN